MCCTGAGGLPCRLWRRRSAALAAAEVGFNDIVGVLGEGGMGALSVGSCRGDVVRVGVLFMASDAIYVPAGRSRGVFWAPGCSVLSGPAIWQFA